MTRSEPTMIQRQSFRQSEIFYATTEC